MFIPDRFHKQNRPPYQHKVCGPSEIFRTACPLFYIVVFRQATSTEHTISVLFNFFCRFVSERNS